MIDSCERDWGLGVIPLGNIIADVLALKMMPIVR